jgi:hypothetical protein
VGKHAKVGQGERSTCHVVQRQPVIARPLGDFVGLLCDLYDRLLIDIPNDRHDQHAVLQGDSDADVDVIEQEYSILHQSRIQDRILPQAVRKNLHNEVGEGQAHTSLIFDSGNEFATKVHKAGSIDFTQMGKRSVPLMTARHVIGKHLELSP